MTDRYQLGRTFPDVYDVWLTANTANLAATAGVTAFQLTNRCRRAKRFRVRWYEVAIDRGAPPSNNTLFGALKLTFLQPKCSSQRLNPQVSTLSVIKENDLPLIKNQNCFLLPTGAPFVQIFRPNSIDEPAHDWFLLPDGDLGSISVAVRDTDDTVLIPTFLQLCLEVESVGSGFAVDAMSGYSGLPPQAVDYVQGTFDV